MPPLKLRKKGLTSTHVSGVNGVGRESASPVGESAWMQSAVVYTTAKPRGGGAAAAAIPRREARDRAFWTISLNDTVRYTIGVEVTY